MLSLNLTKEFLFHEYVTLNKSTRTIGKMLGCSREPIRIALKNFSFKPGTVKSKLTGIKLSKERCLKLSKSHIGLTRNEKHGNWKGDAVGYTALHLWVQRRKPKPKTCECCGKRKQLLDLANISQLYKRDLTDWEYLCRKCHMTKDGRLSRLQQRRKK